MRCQSLEDLRATSVHLTDCDINDERYHVHNASTISIDYRQRAELYKPTDGAALAASIRELADRGLKSHDIAVALHLGISAVEQALRGEA